MLIENKFIVEVAVFSDPFALYLFSRVDVHIASHNVLVETIEQIEIMQYNKKVELIRKNKHISVI